MRTTHRAGSAQNGLAKSRTGRAHVARALGAFLATSMALSSATVDAQALTESNVEAVLHFEVQGIEEPERLSHALTEDLGRMVTLQNGRPLLQVVVDEAQHATLTYHPVDGVQRTRTVVVSADPEAALVELTLVGSNLVRDQTEGLIGDALPAPPDPEPASVAATSDAALTPSADTSESDPLSPSTNLAQEHPLHFGIAGFFGIDVDSSVSPSNVRPFGTYGLSLSGTVNEFVSLGVTRLSAGGGYSSIDGAIFALEGTPFMEAFSFIDRRVQVYGQLGVAIQGRTQTSINEGVVQVAPFLGGGLRVWPFETFSIGVELGAHVVVTDAYLVANTSLPQFSVPATIGLSAEWHILP